MFDAERSPDTNQPRERALSLRSSERFDGSTTACLVESTNGVALKPADIWLGGRHTKALVRHIDYATTENAANLQEADSDFCHQHR
jgi:hypothetical protein